jgi:hypothetical protein
MRWLPSVKKNNRDQCRPAAQLTTNVTASHDDESQQLQRLEPVVRTYGITESETSWVLSRLASGDAQGCKVEMRVEVERFRNLSVRNVGSRRHTRIQTVQKVIQVGFAKILPLAFSAVAE